MKLEIGGGPDKLVESGVPTKITARITNRTRDWLVALRLNEVDFSASPLRYLIGGNVNVLAPGTSVEVTLWRDLSPGTHQVELQLSYAKPSKPFLETALFRVDATGRKSGPSLTAIDLARASAASARVPLYVRNPMEDPGKELFEVRATKTVRVISDPVVDKVRRKLRLIEFRRGLPRFGYAFRTDSSTFVGDDKNLRELGDVALDALAVLASLLENEGRAMLHTSLDASELGLLGLRTISLKSDIPSAVHRRIPPGPSGEVAVDVSRADLSKLWKYLLAGSRTRRLELLNGNEVWILRKE